MGWSGVGGGEGGEVDVGQSDESSSSCRSETLKLAAGGSNRLLEPAPLKIMRRPSRMSYYCHGVELFCLKSNQNI